MTPWVRGMAALYLGEWPCHVLTVDAARSRAVVRFLGGDAPSGAQAEAAVSLARLSRPRLPRWLDRPAMRHWTTKKNVWTGAELRRLRAEAESRPLASVAADLGRPVAACEIALYRWFGTKSVDRRMSLRRVGRVLGWDSHRVRRMIRERVLRATPAGVGAGKHERWAVSSIDLDAFLYAHPERYDWRQIEPGPWRDRAEAIHSADPLLTVEEAALRLCLAPSAVSRRIREGRLAAVWSDGGQAGSGRRWLIRSSVVDAIDLDGWLARRVA